jgi:hypothetical protein
VISKTAEQVLYKKDDQKSLLSMRGQLYSRVPSPSKASKLYNIMHLSCNNKDKLDDDTHNLKVLVQRTIPEEDKSIQEVDLSSDFKIDQAARSNFCSQIRCQCSERRHYNCPSRAPHLTTHQMLPRELNPICGSRGSPILCSRESSI